MGTVIADVQQTLRAEVLAQTAEQRDTAIRKLVALHDEATGHAEFRGSGPLRKATRRVRARLRHVADELRDGLEDLSNRQPVASLSGSRRVLSTPRGNVLTQQLGGAGGPGVRPQLPGDNGAQLVELIERTIAPDIWDTNGGPASIVYYAPKHALVVRAPSQVQEDVVGLMANLRAAGQ